MKGVVFCEFLEFVEHSFGEETLEAMLETSNVATMGAYTSVGRYDFKELAALVGALSKLSERAAPQLIHAFGRHLFGRLAALHPKILQGVNAPLDLLERVEDTIHVEVLKLYPDAELPSLSATRLGPDALRLEYRSCRPLGALCLGLIEGCAAHYGATLHIEAQTTPQGLSILIEQEAVKESAPHAATAL